MKKIYFIIIALLLMFYIVSEVRKKKLSISESFWWVFASICMIILSIFPNIIGFISKIFGVEYPPSILFMFCIIFLVFISFKNNKKIAIQEEKILELEQNVALLKSERRK